MRRLSLLAPIALLGAALLLTACGPSKTQVAESAAADAYMAKSAKEPGVVTLPSGLQYKIIRSGPATGPHPKLADEVKIHYEGKLVDGTVFDSSYERGAPAGMPLNMLIDAWKEALPMMRPGDEWRLIVPPKLGYGAGGQGQIPPNAVLIFRIELLDILANPEIGRG